MSALYPMCCEGVTPTHGPGHWRWQTLSWSSYTPCSALEHGQHTNIELKFLHSLQCPGTWTTHKHWVEVLTLLAVPWNMDNTQTLSWSSYTPCSALEHGQHTNIELKFLHSLQCPGTWTTHKHWVEVLTLLAVPWNMDNTQTLSWSSYTPCSALEHGQHTNIELKFLHSLQSPETWTTHKHWVEVLTLLAVPWNMNNTQTLSWSSYTPCSALEHGQHTNIELKFLHSLQCPGTWTTHKHWVEVLTLLGVPWNMDNTQTLSWSSYTPCSALEHGQHTNTELKFLHSLQCPGTWTTHKHWVDVLTLLAVPRNMDNTQTLSWSSYTPCSALEHGQHTNIELKFLHSLQCPGTWTTHKHWVEVLTLLAVPWNMDNTQTLSWSSYTPCSALKHGQHTNIELKFLHSLQCPVTCMTLTLNLITYNVQEYAHG